MNRQLAAEHGQGLVEFAVIFPLFITLIFVMIDGGLLMGRYNQVNHAAQEGARLGATGANGAAIAARAQRQANNLLSGVPVDCSGGEQVCVQWFKGPNNEPAGQVGSSVRVKIRYDYGLLTPLDNFGFPDHMDVDSCAIARLERPLSSVSSSGDHDDAKCEE